MLSTTEAALAFCGDNESGNESTGQLSYYSTFTPMYHTPVKQTQAANGPNGIEVNVQQTPTGTHPQRSGGREEERVRGTILS